MPYRTLGRTGLKVSLLSFGAWVTFNDKDIDEQCYQIMKRAFENGINFFDNAEVYGDGNAETVMGRVFQRGLKEKIWTREELVVTTKLFFGTNSGSKDRRHPNAVGLSRKHIVEGMRASLKRLQLDYVDVVFCHRPDLVTPLEETVRAMNHVIDQGYAFYWGTSEWPAEMIAEAHAIADRLHLIGPCVEQPEYNIFHRERVEVEYARVYERYGTGLTIWSPLASGILTGKYSGGKVPPNTRLGDPAMAWLKNMLLDDKATEPGGKLYKADQFVAYAKELGMTAAQLAIAWCATSPVVSTVILGARTLEQLEENLSAVEKIPLVTAEVRAKIDELFGGVAYPQSLKMPAMIAATANPPALTFVASKPVEWPQKGPW